MAPPYEPLSIPGGGAAVTDPESASAVERISTPTLMLWAPRGILDQSLGLYTEEQIDQATARIYSWSPTRWPRR